MRRIVLHVAALPVCATLLLALASPAVAQSGAVKGQIRGEAAAVRAGPVFGAEPLDTFYGLVRTEARTGPASSHAKAALYDLNILDTDTPAQRSAETDFPAPNLPRKAEASYVEPTRAGPFVTSVGRFWSSAGGAPDSRAEMSLAALDGDSLLSVGGITGFSRTWLQAGVLRSAVKVSLRDVRIPSASVIVESIVSSVTLESDGTRDGVRIKTSSLVHGASVAGNGVVVDQKGAHAAQGGVPLTQPTEQQEQVDRALAEAGIELRAIRSRSVVSKDGRTAGAEAPGLLVSVAYSDEAVQGGGLLQLAGARASVIADPVTLDPAAAAPVDLRPLDVTQEPLRVIATRPTASGDTSQARPEVLGDAFKLVLRERVLPGTPGRILWVPTGITLGALALAGLALFLGRGWGPVASLLAFVDRATLPVRRLTLRG